MKVLSVLATAGFASLAAAAVQAPILGAFDDAKNVPGKNPLTFCEDGDLAKDILTVTNVDLDPNPPEKGKELEITAEGALSEDVEDGSYALLTVKMGLITLIKTKEDLCTQLEKVDKKCPLKKGPLTFKKSVDLPAQIPPAKFTVHAEVYNKDDKRITCMEAKDIKFD